MPPTKAKTAARKTALLKALLKKKAEPIAQQQYDAVPTTPTPPEIEVPDVVDTHPLAWVALENAMGSYNEARAYIDSIQSDAESTEFNFVYNYVKGSIYYRLMQMTREQDIAKGFFEKSLESYTTALKFKPKDTNTEINIELLLKSPQAGSISQPVKKQGINQPGNGKF